MMEFALGCLAGGGLLLVGVLFGYGVGTESSKSKKD